MRTLEMEKGLKHLACDIRFKNLTVEQLYKIFMRINKKKY